MIKYKVRKSDWYAQLLFEEAHIRSTRICVQRLNV